jgi:hypothetical protein
VNAFAGLYGRVNGGRKIQKVKNEGCQKIGYVSRCNFVSSENNGNCPPEGGAVDEQ